MSRHIPVLLTETVELLNLKSNDNVVDCTLGDAGHSEAILEKIAPNGKLLGIDADIEAILRAKRFLYKFEERAVLIRNNFENLTKIISENNFSPINAILMDLGWSTPQFEERGRGLSFLKDEPLDMRYHLNTNDQTAANIINHYSEQDLKKIFHEYGEEKLSAEIAKAIIIKRKEKEIFTTGELTKIILNVYRTKLKTDKEVPWVGGLHPATKVFQALRIETNRELQTLKNVLPQAVEVLSSGGRLAIISFHSLEDRIVKQFFKKIEHKTIKIITKKPITAAADELNFNPRSRSAKLRVVEKI